MASSTYGRKLNPYRRLRDPLGVKGVRQSVVVTNNPSSIDQNQQLLVRFPNLGAHDVVVPGTARLAFTVSLTSTDANRTIVKNVGRAVVKKTTIKISGNEVLSIDDSDVLHCYQDLWKTAQERRNSQYQGIDLSDDSNVTRIRVGAGNKDETETDAAIAAAFGNRYHVPLDFELLESHMPFYQSALGDPLEYELTFNDYSRVVVATGDAAASYSIDNIALEFDMVTQPDLARQIKNQYAGRLAVLYERVLRHRKITANKWKSGSTSKRDPQPRYRPTGKCPLYRYETTGQLLHSEIGSNQVGCSCTWQGSLSCETNTGATEEVPAPNQGWRGCNHPTSNWPYQGHKIPYLVPRTTNWLSPLWWNTDHWPYAAGVCIVTGMSWWILHSRLIECSLRDNSWDLHSRIPARSRILLSDMM